MEIKCVNFFKRGDLNVKTSVLYKSPAANVSKAYFSDWINKIVEIIGKDVVKSKSTVRISITNSQNESATAFRKGKEIINFIRMLCDKPESLRIDITTNNSTSSYVIFVE